MTRSILFLMLFGTLVSFSQSFTIGNINYEVIAISPGTVKVVEGTDATGSFSIPEKVAHDGVIWTVTAIGSRAFFEKSITSITIPNTITSIEGAAFEKSTLTSIEIPDSVISIGTTAFKSMTELKMVTLPNTLTTLAAGIFDITPSLKNITIPRSVKTISFAAFQNSGINTVTLEASTPPIFTGNAFNGVDLSTATLIVPNGTKMNYEVADVWKDFGTIQEASTLSNEAFGIENDIDIIVSNQTLSIRSKGSFEFLKLKLYNIDGAEVLTSTIEENNINRLVSGLYFIKIITDKGAVSKKIIL